MASIPNYCSASIVGQTTKLESTGLTINIPDMFTAITPIRFSFDTDALGVYYTDTNDKVYLVASNGAKHELTRTGSHWTLTPSPSTLFGYGIRPGDTLNLTGNLVFERKDSGSEVRTMAISFAFNIKATRDDTFNPYIWGTPIIDLDAWDCGTTAGSVTEWDDRTVYERKATEGTNPPALSFDPFGRAQLDFNGSNSKLTLPTDLSWNSPFSLFVVAKVRNLSATYKVLMTIGDLKMQVNSSNLRVSMVANVDYAHAYTNNDIFVFTATKAASNGAQRARGGYAAASTGGTATLTPGTTIIGTDTSTFIDGSIMKILGYNAVLSSSNEEQVIRALVARHGASAA